MPEPSSRRRELVLRYASVADARRDRLPDRVRGLIARAKERFAEAEQVAVRIELEREGVMLEALGRVRWVTPLASGSLLGLELEGATQREQAQLDLLVGLRGSPGSIPALTPLPGALTPVPSLAAALGVPPLCVAMLQPNKVLREVLAGTLVRLATQLSGRQLHLDTASDPAGFLDALSARKRDLAIVDCDGIGTAADALIDRIRKDPAHARVPLVLLSRDRAARAEDPYTVSMQKPIAMKALLHTTGILLRA
jgi:hypothetical protein